MQRRVRLAATPAEVGGRRHGPAVGWPIIDTKGERGGRERRERRESRKTGQEQPENETIRCIVREIFFPFRKGVLVVDGGRVRV